MNSNRLYLLIGLLLATLQGGKLAGATPTGQNAPIDAQALCAVPPYLLATDSALPHAREARSESNTLHVLMVGANAMAGHATSAPALSFADQFARQLVQRQPELRLKLTRFAARGQTLAQSVKKIEDNIETLQPDLVIWQIGLGEVASRMPLHRFNDLIEQGIAAVQATGRADLILLDFPYYREAHLLLDPDDYRELIQFRASYEQIPLFSVYDLMRYWAERETFAPDPAARTRRERAQSRADQIHHCLASALAAQVLRGLP